MSKRKTLTKRRSVGSNPGSMGTPAKDSLMMLSSRQDQKENQQNTRKNRAYQELKREIEHKKKLKEKEESEKVTREHVRETTYVDRDRAAAVTIGSKDLKSDMKGKRRRDFRKKREGDADEDDDECDKETFFAQGRHELKNGEAERALFYFNKAHEAGLKTPLLYVCRSEANCMLGNHEDANEDADIALKDDDTAVPALLAKAETQYHQGSFEHALIYFFRAQTQRPDYKRTRLGINKAKTAITNCLSKSNGFDFLDMKEIIEDIQQREQEQERLEKEREEAELKALEKELLPDESGDEEDLEESESKESDLKMANKTVTPLDLVEILGKKTKEGISDKIAETLIVQSHAIKGIGPSPQGSEKKKKKTDRGEVRSANKQLLGKLHTDHQYLESLLKNPLLTKKYRGTEGLNTIPKKIMQCASEGLEFLDERKDFWQQQKPVYARKNEMHSYQKSKNFLKKLNTMEHEQKPSLSDRRGALPSTS